jgi:transposase InsO family protein
MAREVVAMDVRLRAAVADDAVSVAGLCRELRISRQTFYKWRARYRAEGLAGLEARSRAPRSSPQRVSAATEERIIELRKHLDELGVDAGPGTIQWHLGRAGHRPVPSEATIWRVLVRRGFVVPEPRKRPNTSWQRFVADRPNELWQTDFIEWVVADHSRVVHVLSFLDDHSRVALRCRAVPVATTDAAWETFSQAAACWGLPLGQLSDNGLCFSGKLRGVQVAFETHLRAAGVKPITSRPYHPQTCGKVERFQQTLKKWLRRQPLAADLDELQDQLDRFVDYYNHRRPHRSIGRRVPADAWAATPAAINLGTTLPGPTRTTTTTVDKRGLAEAHRFQIHVGVQHAGQPATVYLDDTHAVVFTNGTFTRVLQLDHSRRYQPSGLPRGPRPLP